ncbi:MAG: DUF711 family protein [Anaerolineae bacterium]|nr:DUF711 family protein [Anaerolineae bacterium]
MKIRSITAFTPVRWPLEEGTIAGVNHFLNDARSRLNRARLDVQTVRLATPPFLDILGDPDPAVLIEFARSMEELADKDQIDAVSIGPVVATTPLALLMSIQALPQLIAETRNIFSGILFADVHSGINLTAAAAFAQIIQQVAQTTPNGRGNFRLAALANVPANIPYFPAAYHQGGLPCFTIAMEAADLALAAISQARTLNDAHQYLILAIERATASILKIVDSLVDDHQLRFRGIDFSLAPFPSLAHSIGAAIESLGIDSFGGNGTLFATHFLTNAIRTANIPRTGFSGVMMPVLEDNVLAQRAADGLVSVNDLLLYSAVCGTGLDAIPIPGDTPPGDLAALYLDLAALAVSVNKPLTARLLPIPGLKAGDEISFDSEYFATSRVMPVKRSGAEKLFQRGSFFKSDKRG